MRNASVEGGFRLNFENVEKTIIYLKTVGRTVYEGMAREVGREMVAEGTVFDSATEAVEAYRCRVWNSGYVH